MLTNKNQAIVSGLLGLGIAGFATATALPFNDRIEYLSGWQGTSSLNRTKVWENGKAKK